jgi:hypothetical protein
MDDSKHTYDMGSALRANAFTLVGWRFNGWNTLANGNGTAYADGASVKTLTSTNNGTFTMYAQWVPNTYNVAYDKNKPSTASAATVGGTMQNSQHTYDTPSQLSTNAYTLTGWTLSGWNTQADGNGTTYASNASVSTLNPTHNGTTTLYAKWTQYAYTVKYDKNKPSNASGSVSGIMDDSSHRYDLVSFLRINAYALTGWTFNGWSTQANGGGTSYIDGASISVLNSANNGTTTLYAKWVAVNYSVVYNSNKPSDATGTIGGSMANTTHIYDTASALRTNGFTLTGWNISGWATSTSGSVVYSNGGNISTGHAINGGTLTLYARWTRKSYTVLFDKQSGTDGADGVWAYYDSIMPAATAPTFPGYDFGGYYTGTNGSGTQYYTASMGSVRNWNIASNTTLYAKWTAITYYVKTYAIDKSGPSDIKYIGQITCTYGQTYSLTASSISGYTFDHWRKGGFYGVRVSSSTVTIYNETTVSGEVYYVDAYYSKNCVAEGTLITLADGSQKAVELLDGNELLLVWNLHTGSFDIAPILFIDSDEARSYEITHLYFSDGTEVKVIAEHGFWDIDLNMYVFLRNDAAQYIGHWFNKGDGISWTAVQLVAVQIYSEYTTSWSPVTFGHLCYYVNGMLSMPGSTEGLINIFDVDAVTMQYDMAAFADDIALYGLLEYSDVEEIMPELVFEAFGGQFLSVSIGKELITWEEIFALLERYAPFFANI